MAKLIIIAAIGKNLELGKNNNLIWRLKGDLKFFKENTLNHKIVMGYNTFISLGNVLPGRTHLVLTHHDIDLPNVYTFNTLEELLIYLDTLEEDVFIIGGATIYKLFIDKADELLLTEIQEEDRESDVYFPKFDRNDYESELIDQNRENDINYSHMRLRRIKNER